MGMPEGFPRISPPQVVLVHCETRTGIVLDLEGRRWTGSDKYRIFASVSDAEAYALSATSRNQEIECAIFDHEHKPVSVIRPAWTSGRVAGVPSSDHLPAKADYHFLTVWQIAAPVQRVWDVLSDPEHYGEWWPSFVGYRCLTRGVRGPGMRDERFVRGSLPYTLRFQTTVTAVDPPRSVEYRADGGLLGSGRVTLTGQQRQTLVTIEWNVRAASQWARLLHPILHPLLRWNHARVMQQGERGLNRKLGAI